MRALKIFLGTVGGLLVAVALAIAALVFVDPSAYRNQLQARASAALGRTVQLNGPITLEPSLQPRIVLHDLVIGNVEWAAHPHFVAIQEVDVKVRLLPLLLGDLTVPRISFAGVDLNLEKRSDGLTNFTFGETNEPRERDVLALLPDIHRLLIRDARIQYRSESGTLSLYKIKEAWITDIPGEPEQLELDGSIRGQAVTAAIGTHADAGLSSLENPWSMKIEARGDDLSLTADVTISDVRTWERLQASIELSGDQSDSLETLLGVDLPVTGPYALSSDVSVKSGFVELSDLTAEVPIAGDRPGIEILKGTASGGAADPIVMDLQGETNGVPLRLRLKSGPFTDLTSSDATWPVEAQLNLADAELDVHGAVARNTAGTRLDLDARLAGSDLKALGPGLGLELPETGTYEMSLGISGADGNYRFSDLQGTAQGIDPWDKIRIVRGEASTGLSDAVKATLEGTLDDVPFTVSFEGGPWVTEEEKRTWPVALESSVADAKLTANGSVVDDDEQKLQVDVKLKGDSLETLGSVAGVSFPSVGSYVVSARINRAAETVDVKDLKARIGASDLAGSLQWKDAEPRPRLTGKLSSETIELPQPAAASPKPAPKTQAEDPLDRPVEIDWLKTVDVDLTADVKRVVGQPVPIEQLKIETVVSDGQLNAPFSVRAASVSVNGRVKFTGSGGDPVLSLRAKATQVDVGSTLELLGMDRKTAGRTVGKVDVVELKASSQGKTMRSLLENTAANLKAQGGVRYADKLLNRDVKVNVKSVDVSVARKGPLKVAVEGALGEGPLSLSAATATVANLMSGKGPWPLNASIKTSFVQVKSRGSVAQPLKGKGFKLAIEVDGDEVAGLDPLLDFTFPFKGAFLIKGQFTDRNGTYTLDKLKARVGKSDLTGNISITTDGPRPKLVASLAAQAIDFDDLDFGVANDTRSKEGPFVITDYTIPVDALDSANVDLDFRTERVRIGARSLGDLRFRIKLENGRFVMSPFTGSHSTGMRVNGRFELDASTSPPKLRLQFTAKDLDYGLLLNHLAVTDLTEGQIDVLLELSGSGVTHRSLISSADGRLVIAGEEGKIRSRLLDLWAADLATIMLSPQWRREPVTDLRCIAVHVDLQKGKAEIHDLLLDTRRITIAGAGILNLGTEELNVVIAPRPKNPSLVSFANPVDVRGTLSNPNITVRRIPRRGRLLGIGAGILAGLVNPLFLLAAFADTGTSDANRCVSATDRVRSKIDSGG